MKKKYFPLLVIIISLIFVSSNAYSVKVLWKTVGKGLDYTSIRVLPGIIHAFKIDPKQNKFGVVTAKDLGKKSAYVRAIAKKYGALLAINGGFFTPEYDSLGLLINNGKVINPVKNTSWWSIFYIKNNSPKIIHTNSFKNSSSISMAIQSGPRLVVNGAIPKLKSSIAERSAICITPKKDVIIVATQNLLIQPAELANYLRKSESEGGLGCFTALNLDGGSSTQLYAKIGSFDLEVTGMNKVSNAVVVYPKSK